MKMFPALIVTFILLVTGCSDHHDNTNVKLSFDKRINDNSLASISKNNGNDAYYFGFDIRNSPKEDAKQYLPFLDYLSDTTGLKFKLKFTPKNKSTSDLLGSGEVHFASIGATSFIKAKHKYSVIPIARGLNSSNKAEYQSVIVVSQDSNIKSLKELKNKAFAFGNIDSTQGHLIPRIILSNQNIKLEDFSKYKYLGSHLNCAQSVIKKSFDACGMQDTLAKKLEKEGKVRILYTSDYFPSSGVAASSTVPDNTIQSIKRALLNFEPDGIHGNNLYHWNLTEMPKGFTNAKVEDYKDLEYWMNQLGFL